MYISYQTSLSTIQLIAWSVIWVGLIISSFFIANISRLATHLGLYDFIEFVVVLSIVILFYLHYRQMVANSELTTQITKLVREIALLKHKKPKKKK